MREGKRSSSVLFLARKGLTMNGCLGLLTVAGLIYANPLIAVPDLPQPRQAPAQTPARPALGAPGLGVPQPTPPDHLPGPEVPLEKKGGDGLPPGGTPATISPGDMSPWAGDSPSGTSPPGQGAVIHPAGSQPAGSGPWAGFPLQGAAPLTTGCQSPVEHPPLGWVGLRPPAPAVVDCRSGAWQQVYVPLDGPTASQPPVGPAAPVRVGISRRCCLAPPLPCCCPRPCSGLLRCCFQKKQSCPEAVPPGSR